MKRTNQPSLLLSASLPLKSCCWIVVAQFSFFLQKKISAGEKKVFSGILSLEQIVSLRQGFS